MNASSAYSFFLSLVLYYNQYILRILVYITVASAVAEGQVKEKHENITWTIRKQIRNGTSPLYTKPCYGYKKDDNGELVINHEEANVVKMVFDKYLEGYSIIGIIDYLYNLKIPFPTGFSQ